MQRVIIRRVPRNLKVNKGIGKISHCLRKPAHDVAFLAFLFCITMIERAVSLSPGRSASLRALPYEGVCKGPA